MLLLLLAEPFLFFRSVGLIYFLYYFQFSFCSMEKEWDLKVKDVCTEINVFVPMRNHLGSTHSQSTSHHKKNMLVRSISIKVRPVFTYMKRCLWFHENLRLVCNKKLFPSSCRNTNLWDFIVSLPSVTLPIINLPLPCGALRPPSPQKIR